MEFIISFSVIYLILWISYYIFLNQNFKNRFNNGISFKRNFTFETHNFESSANVALRIGYIALSFIGITPFVYFIATNPINYTIDVYIVISGAFLLVSLFLKVLLFFTKTLNIKLFIGEYVFRLLTLLGSIGSIVAGIMITIWENMRLYNENSGLLQSFLIIFIILFIINASCLCFKKFYNWFEFEKDEDGTIKKPNIILTALYEWIFGFSEIILVILVGILSYFMV